MNTKTHSRKWSWIQLNERRAARAGILLLLWLTLPAAVHAQFTYTTTNGTITIIGYTGPGGAVIIPDRIPDTTNGLPVAIIGDSAFKNSSSLTSIAIPNSVITIGTAAFSGCHRLTSVTIGTNVTSIGDSAFTSCSMLTSVSIPYGVTIIGTGAFHGCTDLTNVTIPNSVIIIGGHAFGRCFLASVTIPNSVTTIGDSAFMESTLTDISIPNSVTTIGDQVFYYCLRLTAITVDTNNPAYSSLDGVLFNKSQTALIKWPGAKAGSYTIPSGVTSIGRNAFSFSGLTSVTIPNSVTTIGNSVFSYCPRLTSVTIPNSVTSIGDGAFSGCSSLTNVTIGNGVARIEDWTFGGCTSLAGVCFQGNAPSIGGTNVFSSANNATVYYLSGTTGWGTEFGGRPTVLWNPPAIQASPRTQTAEARSAVSLGVEVGGASPLFCVWYFNSTNLISCSTNRGLNLTDVQLSQSGAYTVMISNVFGTVTSAPALLNVIAAVERRPVPGVKVTGEAGSLLNVNYADSLSPAPTWAMLGSVSLASTSQYYFDLALPLPPQRFYRAWQTGTLGVIPSLDLHMVPAITLTGSIGNSLRLDYINQFGPIDAWVTLDTVTLTNTSQLYFDVSAPGQPQRLYRLVPLP